jgi:hypothetical protein
VLLFEKEMKLLDNKKNKISRPVPIMENVVARCVAILLVSFIN